MLTVFVVSMSIDNRQKPFSELVSIEESCDVRSADGTFFVNIVNCFSLVKVFPHVLLCHQILS